jgi:hypothetical protein
VSSPSTSRCAIDHLVVAAASLEAGAQYIRATLGVELEPGGEHARMGTHNRLLRLGDGLYLEVIAINPAAAQPTRARWFELDRMARDAPPRLVTWLVRTHDIEASVARCEVPLGRIEHMMRGTLSWRITIPADGSLPFDGIMPSIIEWQAAQHPSNQLPDHGCRLLRLEGRHAEAERIQGALAALDVDAPVMIVQAEIHASPQLTAIIDTPAGVRTLRSLQTIPPQT